MAVPKCKISKQRGNKRFANWKLEPNSLVECPQCHNYKENHKVCPSCGYYDGKPIVDMNKEKKE